MASSINVKTLGQRTRLILLVVYLGGLLLASWLALGTWLPPTSEKGLWFYSALAALLLGNLLVSPFFTKPVDTISYAVAALIALLAVTVWGQPNYTGFDRFLWVASLIYAVIVLAAGITAIVTKDATSAVSRNLGRTCFVLGDALGSPRAIFSVVFLFALIVFHRTEAQEYIIIGIAWAVFVGLRPLEALVVIAKRLQEVWRSRTDAMQMGVVVGHESPGIVLVREGPAVAASFGTLLCMRRETGEPGVAVALDHVGFSDGRWLRAIHLHSPSIDHSASPNRFVSEQVKHGQVYALDDDHVERDIIADATDVRERMVGIVAPDTTVGKLQVELIRSDLSLAQGQMLEATVGRQRVLYQIVEGITREEILQQKNTRGYIRGQARKIGTWDNATSSFLSVPWLPAPNTPVLLTCRQEVAADKNAIGHFPSTAYPVRVDPHQLVTHNAAILGILGVGKTYLALELVERLIEAGIKVICLDLTDQYAQQLSEYIDAAAEQQRLDELAAVGPAGKTNCQRNVEEGGSINEFSEKISEQLSAFLSPDNADKIRIFNPATFEVWRQGGGLYQNQAAMATLTPTEITRLITETALEVVQQQGMTDEARCCLVYEEAHSLIPEWNAVASDGDKSATNGTAKAILQGRKFGLGCLVITQRTANVTKSILNQCNTIFALRVFDATGMEFLRNYIGDDYAGVLSTLEDRHAVVFGRASSCKDPVLVRLNDRQDFLAAFRQVQPDEEVEVNAETAQSGCDEQNRNKTAR